MLSAPQRNVLEWVRPSPATRYEIFRLFGPESAWALPQAVLTINGPISATLETRVGTYTFRRQSLFANLFVTDADGSLIATVQTGWWGQRNLRFTDGREFRFVSSNLIRTRWIWNDGEGEARALVRRNQIFFAPGWPAREGLIALLAGLTIYFMAHKPFIFTLFS